MSRPGCPYDNAMAESFMETLKQEEVDAANYRDLAHATAAIGDFIEAVYNTERRSQTKHMGCCAAAHADPHQHCPQLTCLIHGGHSRTILLMSERFGGLGARHV